MAKTYSRPPKAPEAHRKFEARVTKAQKTGTKIKVADMPRREMVIFYYEKKGYKVVPGTTRKFVTMEMPGQENKVFVGGKGGVMIGKNISSAFSRIIDYKILRQWINTYLHEHQGGK